jgi:hypothetical protein
MLNTCYQMCGSPRTSCRTESPGRLEAESARLSPADIDLVRKLAEGTRRSTIFDITTMYGKPHPLMTLDDFVQFGQWMLPWG